MSSLTDTITLPVADCVPAHLKPVKIPRFGLGVYESEGEDCYKSVLWALEAGYRLIEWVSLLYHASAVPSSIIARQSVDYAPVACTKALQV